MRFTHRSVRTIVAFSVAVTAACSSPSEPEQTDLVEGRWEGFNGAGVEYVYVFSATETNETNPRTGNVGRVYSLEFTTTPGGSGTVSAWYEDGTVYWGGTSLGMITEENAMTVQSASVEPFIMHKRP